MSDASSSHRVFPRSWLFTPAHHPRRVSKALASGAEAVIVDLEDAVPADQREAALRTLSEISSDAAAPRRAWYVRVHPVGDARFEVDVKAAVDAGAAGIVLAKAQCAADVRRAERLLALQRERFEVVPVIETPAGLLEAAAIMSAGKHVSGVMFGAEDFAVRLGPYVGQTAPGSDMQQARGMLALAAAARGVPAIDKVCLAVRDAAHLTTECEQACELGYSGKAIIHPDQIAPVHAVMRPSAGRLAWARRVLDAMAAARAKGDSVVVVDGQMIDPPVVRRAQETVTIAEHTLKDTHRDE